MTKTYELPNKKMIMADVDEKHHTATVSVYALDDLVEAVNKTGRWIEHDCESLRRIGYYRCSECNHGYQRYERGVRKSEVPYINGQKYELHRTDNFCPYCGAKMESEE